MLQVRVQSQAPGSIEYMGRKQLSRDPQIGFRSHLREILQFGETDTSVGAGLETGQTILHRVVPYGKNPAGKVSIYPSVYLSVYPNLYIYIYIHINIYIYMCVCVHKE